jgi:hypothetical protein
MARKAVVPGKVLLREIASGEITERWPIDAREMVKAGGYAPFVDEPGAVAAPDDRADQLEEVVQAQADTITALTDRLTAMEAQLAAADTKGKK